MVVVVVRVVVFIAVVLGLVVAIDGPKNLTLKFDKIGSVMLL